MDRAQIRGEVHHPVQELLHVDGPAPVEVDGVEDAAEVRGGHLRAGSASSFFFDWVPERKEE